jgi:GNAT superfamily N-acetyltransferase
MNLAFVRILADSREDLLEGRPSSVEEIRSIRERHGEKIAAVDPDSARALGWIGVFPGKDEGGAFYNLAGIEVLPGHRGEGIDVALMEEAARFIRARKVQRMKFGTSPLLTANAELYITRFGTRYRWRGGARTAEGAPWPYVTCECDFDDPLARPLDLRDEEVLARSVVAWEGQRPVPRERVVYSGPLSVALPEWDTEALAEAGHRDPSFLPTLYAAFHALFIHGYGFAWFDSLPHRLAPPGGPRFYYVMNRVLGL